MAPKKMTQLGREFAPRPRPRAKPRLVIAIAITLLTAIVLCLPFFAKAADQKQIQRGKYLVTIGGCMDCHTPGYFFGKPDMARFLGGSEVGFEIPGLGVFHGSNLTPDKETGLGNWTEAQIITAIQTGKRPDGRELAPIMPWRAFAQLTKSDAQAMAAFLKSLPPVKNKVPGPFGPTEKPTSFVMKVVPPEGAPPPKQ
jgi:mono/diheme cytochrome c family protein